MNLFLSWGKEKVGNAQGVINNLIGSARYDCADFSHLYFDNLATFISVNNIILFISAWHHNITSFLSLLSERREMRASEKCHPRFGCRIEPRSSHTGVVCVLLNSYYSQVSKMSNLPSSLPFSLPLPFCPSVHLWSGPNRAWRAKNKQTTTKK